MQSFLYNVTLKIDHMNEAQGVCTTNNSSASGFQASPALPQALELPDRTLLGSSLSGGVVLAHISEGPVYHGRDGMAVGVGCSVVASHIPQIRRQSCGQKWGWL